MESVKIYTYILDDNLFIVTPDDGWGTPIAEFVISESNLAKFNNHLRKTLDERAISYTVAQNYPYETQFELEQEYTWLNIKKELKNIARIS